jgi:penicillin-binding protein 1A
MTPAPRSSAGRKPGDAAPQGVRARFAAWRKRHPGAVRAALLLTTFMFFFGTGAAYGSWALVCRGGQCPAVEVLESYTPRQTSKLYAVDGRFIAEIGLERRTLVTLEDIPRMVRQAFIVTEDRRFFQHAGIDWQRVVGAAIADIQARAWEQGFSTITMQLARNVFPERISREKTVVRKLKEAKVAREIESQYTKQKILELYLNQVYFGNGAHGVETASQRYFGKSVRDLNVAEAATLVSVVKAPGRYDPRRYPERVIQRRNTVIELMRRAGEISDADASLAKAYPLRLASRAESGQLGPYYVEWVRKQLDEHFGRQLYEQGLKVYTTLDLDMQSAAERALERQLKSIEGGTYGRFPHTTFEQYQARSGEQATTQSPYLQGALITMDTRTGAIRALVGGRDFDDSKFNRATQALRQPGSTFKPFVYATAVQNGRPVSYQLDDSPLTVETVAGVWSPQNYDGKFQGKIPMRSALYQSRNLAAIRLGMELGEQTVIDMARRFGISTPIPPYPSIHIGAADVYPLELVAAYSAFATLGVRASPYAITKVENARGEVLWEPTPVRTPVMDVVQRGTAAGVVGGRFRHPAGGKTGTTNDGADVWFVGFTADLVTGVWMGFDRPQKIKSNAQGGLLAAPAWTAFMNEVYTRRPAPPDWPRPDGLILRDVDMSTNMLRTPFCPSSVVSVEAYIPGTEPVLDCMAHVPGYDSVSDTLYPRPQPGPTSPVAPNVPGAVQSGEAPVPRSARDSVRERRIRRDTGLFRIP